MKKLMLIGFVVLALAGCKKDKEVSPPPIPTSQIEPPSIEAIEPGANDETARNEYDNSLRVALSSMENAGLGSAKFNNKNLILPCGIVGIDSLNGKYIVRYGSNCGRKKISGTVEGELVDTNKRWNKSGSQIRITYKNYKVFFEANNQTLEFNGTTIVTNVNGGLFFKILIPNFEIVHKVRGTLEITFDDGTKRKWSNFKRRSYVSSTGKAKELIGKLSADSGSISEVGISKKGDEFVTTIPTPFVYENCGENDSWAGPYVLTKGKLVYTVSQNSLQIEPGYQLMEGQFSQVNDCSSAGYKLTWTIGSNVVEKYQSY